MTSRISLLEERVTLISVVGGRKTQSSHTISKIRGWKLTLTLLPHLHNSFTLSPKNPFNGEECQTQTQCYGYGEAQNKSFEERVSGLRRQSKRVSPSYHPLFAIELFDWVFLLPKTQFYLPLSPKSGIVDVMHYYCPGL